MSRASLRTSTALAAALLALQLLLVPAAWAVQASGSILLIASKNAGVANGEQITVDVLVQNNSVHTPGPPFFPVEALLAGPIAIGLRADDDCCGGSVSDLLRLVPGPASGCDEKGAGVTACVAGEDGSILVLLDPAGASLPANPAPVFLARIRLENDVGAGQTLPRINVRAASGVCALLACANPFAQCASCAIEGGTFVKGDADEITYCELHVCGDGTRDERESCDDGNLVDGDGCDANCTVTGCGNGVVTTGESCDDGNAVDGDGCDSNCTPTGCGNGIVTSGEACDDANAEPDDGCDACGIGICPDGRPIVGARLRLARLDGDVGGEDLTFSGRIDCGENGCEVVDPLRYGLELRIDVPLGNPLLDLTERTVVVPSAEGEGCDPYDGWRASSEGRTLVYRNRSGALRAAGCAPGSAHGLRKLQIHLRGAPSSEVVDEIGIRVLAQVSTATAPEAPPRFGIVFTGDPVEALVEPPLCAATSFAPDACGSGPGGEFTCR